MHLNGHDRQGDVNRYTYPEFVIDEKTGTIEINLIDHSSGRIVRHIPKGELDKIVQNYAVTSSHHLFR